MRNKRLIIIFSVLCGLTVLIIINSIIFSVQHVEAYCYNDEDTVLDGQVIDACGVSTGKSIFMLNEDNVIKNIEGGVPNKNVRVVNIERKFPNRIYINYVKILSYFRVECEGKIYYLSNDCVIMSINEQDESLEPAILVRLKGEVLNENAGETLISTDSDDLLKLTKIADALGEIMYRGTAFGIFDSIELAGQHTDTKGFIYLHAKTGVYWEIQNLNNLKTKLHMAWDVYQSSNDYQSSGTIITFGVEKLFASHTSKNRFRDGIWTVGSN